MKTEDSRKMRTFLTGICLSASLFILVNDNVVNAAVIPSSTIPNPPPPLPKNEKPANVAQIFRESTIKEKAKSEGLGEVEEKADEKTQKEEEEINHMTSTKRTTTAKSVAVPPMQIGDETILFAREKVDEIIASIGTNKTNANQKQLKSSVTTLTTTTTTTTTRIATTTPRITTEEAIIDSPDAIMDEHAGGGIENEQFEKVPVVPSPPAPVENTGKHPSEAIDFSQSSDSHFMTYMITCGILVTFAYVLFHNKQKIIGLIVEGRIHPNHGRGHRYRRMDAQLDSTDTEPLRDNERTNVIY